MTPLEIVKTLGQYPTATIYEAAGKLGDMEPGIRPIIPNVQLSGIAYTVKTFPSDTTAVIRALDDAPAGSVLVIDAGGTERSAVWGGTSSLVCSIRGLIGCVTNGCVRDTEDLIKVGIPFLTKTRLDVPVSKILLLETNAISNSVGSSLLSFEIIFL